MYKTPLVKVQLETCCGAHGWCQTRIMLHALLGGLLACATAQTTQCDPSKCSGGTPSCPISAGALSAKAAVVAGEHTENVYFRNAAPFSAEILRVDEQGQEIS